MTAKRANILEKLIVTHGGKVVSPAELAGAKKSLKEVKKLDFVIADCSRKLIADTLKVCPVEIAEKNMIIVNPEWVSACSKKNTEVSMGPFLNFFDEDGHGQQVDGNQQSGR